MTVQIRNLSRIGYGLGITLWVYRAEGQTKRDVMTEKFWSDAPFDAGDWILVTAIDGGMVLHVVQTKPEIEVSPAGMTA